jgi:hypothetical protein
VAYLWVFATTCLALVACGRVANRSEVDAAPDDAAADDASGTVDVQTATCVPTPAGLAGRWRGDMTMKDDLGRYNGTAVGHPAYTAGRHGSAFALNGTDAMISIVDADALWPTGSFSVEGWVSSPAGSPAGRLVAKYECGGACPGGTASSFSSWSLSFTAAGFPELSVRSEPNLVVTITDAQHVITDGSWHYLVGVRDIQTKQLMLYVDGQLTVSRPLSGHQLDPMSNADGEVDPVTIGAVRKTAMTDYIDYLRGAVDEVAYYNAAISADEIQAIFNAPDGECH